MIRTLFTVLIALIAAYLIERSARESWYRGRLLESIALQDSLTGLSNRFQITRVLEKILTSHQEANRAFYRLTVLPLVARVTAGISHWLSGFTGEVVELRPDLDQIPALAVERDQQWARVGAAEFLTASEKRMLLGLPRLAEDE